MTNLNIKYFMYILIPPSILLWVILVNCQSNDQSDTATLLSVIPQVVTVDVICITLFVQWFWKWKWLQGWLVPFPNLNGVWKGSIQSNCANPETGGLFPTIPASLEIKQNFLKINCVVTTDQMRSVSYTGEFRIDSDHHHIKQLIYTYSSSPLPTASNQGVSHKGTVVLEIVKNPDNRQLVGGYWTTIETSGRMDFKFEE